MGAEGAASMSHRRKRPCRPKALASPLEAGMGGVETGPNAWSHWKTLPLRKSWWWAMGGVEGYLQARPEGREASREAAPATWVGALETGPRSAGE